MEARLIRQIIPPKMRIRGWNGESVTWIVLEIDRKKVSITYSHGKVFVLLDMDFATKIEDLGQIHVPDALIDAVVVSRSSPSKPFVLNEYIPEISKLIGEGT